MPWSCLVRVITVLIADSAVVAFGVNLGVNDSIPPSSDRLVYAAQRGGIWSYGLPRPPVDARWGK